MPYDTATFPASRSRDRSTRSVGIWLLVICFMLLVMIALGGATRLNGSGLSIMEWAPLSGAIPPLRDAEWQRLYDLYKQIPQYALVNDGFGLAGFKHIFWLEWVHRLWGRLIGIAFAVPLAVFAWRGLVTRGLLGRLAVLFVLGGLQGAVGWFMVASGFFPDSTAVSPYRLVIHLSLALVLYGAVLWSALDMLDGSVRPGPAASPGLRRLTVLATVLVAVTIVAGGFVAGTRAGLTYNTFPLMDGTLPPPGYGILRPWWRNLTENVAAVQFDHRVLATVAALAGLMVAWRGRNAGGAVGRACLMLGAAVVVQYSLGVATLLTVVAPVLATLHQAVAVLVLSAALAALHAQRRARWHPARPRPAADGAGRPQVAVR